jgi:hypothetical protein
MAGLRGGARPRRADAFFIALLIVCSGAVDVFAGQDPAPHRLIPRVTAPKQQVSLLVRRLPTDRVYIKFAEGMTVDFAGGVLTSTENDLSVLRGVLGRHAITRERIARLFSRPVDELKREKELGQRRSGRELADLTLYYEVRVPAGFDVVALCNELNALPYVELAAPLPPPAPLPVDLDPPTPDFSGQQGYREVAPLGIGSKQAALVWSAGDGSGIKIVDIEYQWVLDHEDLELPASANIDSATIDDPFPDDEGSHGTAVLGELVAKDNGYGVTGIVPAATALVAPANTVEHGYNLARAINLAAGALDPGDVILLEQQTCVCGQTCDDPIQQTGLGPVEWVQPVYDAITAATALGVIVVEAAGNGNVDLDSAGCGGLFDRQVRDSGAIVVGAGTPWDHVREFYSCYGSRVDVHGWGDSIATTGYGALFGSTDVLQRYTDNFGGTSGASPIVSGAVAQIQGIAKTLAGAPLAAVDLRDVLTTTGTPQAQNDPNPIGPLPNVQAALHEISCGNDALDPNEECDGTDAAACPAQCVAPTDPQACECPLGPLDHFLCYRTKAKRDRRGVDLDDPFGSSGHPTGDISSVCVPADKDGQGITDEDTHLTVYKLEGYEAPHTAVPVMTAFGESTLDTKQGTTVMVPATQSLAPAAYPELPDFNADVDSYRCFKVKRTRKSAQPQAGMTVTFTDEFGTRNAGIGAPMRLCLAASLNGSVLQRPDAHLLCFKIKASTKHKRDGVRIRNILDTLEVKLKPEAEACFPATL